MSMIEKTKKNKSVVVKTFKEALLRLLEKNYRT